jgi:hypothetical protein
MNASARWFGNSLAIISLVCSTGEYQMQAYSNQFWSIGVPAPGENWWNANVIGEDDLGNVLNFTNEVPTFDTVGGLPYSTELETIYGTRDVGWNVVPEPAALALALLLLALPSRLMWPRRSAWIAARPLLQPRLPACAAPGTADRLTAVCAAAAQFSVFGFRLQQQSSSRAAASASVAPPSGGANVAAVACLCRAPVCRAGTGRRHGRQADRGLAIPLGGAMAVPPTAAGRFRWRNGGCTRCNHNSFDPRLLRGNAHAAGCRAPFLCYT